MKATMRWTPQVILRIIREVAAVKRYTPSLLEIKAAGGPDNNVISARFGSYRLACERAGLVPNAPGRRTRSNRTDPVRAQQITDEKRRYWRTA